MSSKLLPEGKEDLCELLRIKISVVVHIRFVKDRDCMLVGLKDLTLDVRILTIKGTDICPATARAGSRCWRAQTPMVQRRSC